MKYSSFDIHIISMCNNQMNITLTWEVKTMHEKTLWFNDNIQFLFHENIVEYDMVAASLSISERFKLLEPGIIEELKLLPKEKRTKRVGLLQREDKIFSEQLISGIKDIRRKFIEQNNLTENSIISLHSDAIFLTSKKEIKDNIEGVEFKHKNTWCSYLKYDGMEMFFDGESITYKGISRDILKQHTLGLCKFLFGVFLKLENYDPSILKYLNRFQKEYLTDKLPQYYYVPFGRTGKFKMDNLKLLSYIANVTLEEMKGW